MNSSVFKIYNASAGSGKTFALAKEYLLKIISSNQPGFFRYILAITFTNKAVSEMKNRIVENLWHFSKEKESVLEQENEMFRQICLDTGLSSHKVQQRARKAMDFLLNNYSLFDVETIDKFNHRLIRTFSRDLNLSSNFKVELDAQSMVYEAVDRLIAQIGMDKPLTRTAINFMMEKAEEDKSWDIANDFYQIANLLITENQIPHIQNLEGKTLADFDALRENLYQKTEVSQNQIVALAENFFKIVDEHRLLPDHFNRKYLYIFFEKLKNRHFNVSWGNKWQNFEGAIYPSRVTPSEAALLDELTPVFKDLFDRVKNIFTQIALYRLLLRNINSLAVLNGIREQFLLLQKEQNVLPVSEFNSIIHREIRNQPAPFIYERLGEKYRHFMIDEFQDTSQLQWNNLVPLIDNALSQSQSEEAEGSLFIVGDAKQSIYRWRGGYPEQFMQLYQKQTPFSTEDIAVKTLDTNYRSSDVLIDFNNRFFTSYSRFFSEEIYRDLYLSGNRQKPNTRRGGYVSIRFIEASNDDARAEVYPPAVLEAVNEVLSQGYTHENICILVRKNEQGVLLASYLAENGIAVSSSETLLLNQSTAVQVLINVLRMVVNFETPKAKAKLLDYLYDYSTKESSRYAFIKKYLTSNQKEWQILLKDMGIDFSFENALSIPLYNLCEEIFRKFVSSDYSTAHMLTFLETVFEYSISHRETINGFLEFWSENEALGVDNSAQTKGVKIMTVHKSKGLEFPVVIFPFAEKKVIFNQEQAWYPLDKDEYSGFSELPILLSSKVESMGEAGAALYSKKSRQLQLDVANVVYVAHTRAVEQLYIISNYSKTKDGNDIASVYKKFLEELGIWNEAQRVYTFGKKSVKTSSSDAKALKKTPLLEALISVGPEQHQIILSSGHSKMWETPQKEAIEQGNLLHAILAEITTRNDTDTVLNQFVHAEIISEEQSVVMKKNLDRILAHPKLQLYFHPTVYAVNEQEIYLNNETVIRPDRINFLPDNQLVVIDYKTGKFTPTHEQQINLYADTLCQMGYTVVGKLLVYISEEIAVKEVS